MSSRGTAAHGRASSRELELAIRTRTGRHAKAREGMRHWLDTRKHEPKDAQLDAIARYLAGTMSEKELLTTAHPTGPAWFYVGLRLEIAKDVEGAKAAYRHYGPATPPTCPEAHLGRLALARLE